MNEETIAKPRVDNKFWLLTQNGEKVGVMNRQGSKYVIRGTTNQSAEFSSKQMLLDSYPIRFLTNTKKATDSTELVYGFPVNVKETFDKIYDVTRKLPMFTKKTGSTCWFGSGYYVIFFKKIGWTNSFCPKVITLDKYEFRGPFKDSVEARAELRRLKHGR
jgi:hypothetical protein